MACLLWKAPKRIGEDDDVEYVGNREIHVHSGQLASVSSQYLDIMLGSKNT